MNTRYTLFNDTYVMYQLLEFIDESSIIAICKVSKKLNEICKNYIELEDDKRFEVNTTIYVDDYNILLRQYCLNNDVINIKKIIGMDLNLNYGLYGACEGGNMDVVKLMVEKGATWWDHGLFYACKGGNMDIIKLMIKKGANNWNNGLYSACEGGNMDIIKLMIEKAGANVNWNDGLYGACRGGHMDICKFMIENGATICRYCEESIEEHLS